MYRSRASVTPARSPIACEFDILFAERDVLTPHADDERVKLVEIASRISQTSGTFPLLRVPFVLAELRRHLESLGERRGPARPGQIVSTINDETMSLKSSPTYAALLVKTLLRPEKSLCS